MCARTAKTAERARSNGWSGLAWRPTRGAARSRPRRHVDSRASSRCLRRKTKGFRGAARDAFSFGVVYHSVYARCVHNFIVIHGDMNVI